MCVATLGVVVSRIGDGAIVEVGDETRWVSATLFPEASTGDYVLIAALSIVDRLDGAADDGLMLDQFVEG